MACRAGICRRGLGIAVAGVRRRLLRLRDRGKTVCRLRCRLRLCLLRARRTHLGLRLCLALQCSLQRCHGFADEVRVPCGIGRLQGLGRVQHRAITLAQSRLGGFTFGGFSLEGIVNRFAKCVPQFLFQAPV